MMALYSSALAGAAGSRPSSAMNPFGLPIPGGSNTGGLGGYQGYSLLNPPQPPRGQTTQKSPTQTPVIPIPISPATTPGSAGAPTAQMPLNFDLQTDPALQQVNALAGLSDQQATAQALKERQQLLLQYGDPRLAASVLGQSDPNVQAAAQNPESQLAMLGRQRDQNLNDFLSQLDPSLLYGGYRVGQERQLGQAYQDALAQAAAGAQSGLDQITGNLNAQMQTNQMSRANALEQAYMNELQLILAGLGGGGGGGAGGGAPPPPIPAEQGGRGITGAPAVAPTAGGVVSPYGVTGGAAGQLQRLQQLAGLTRPPGLPPPVGGLLYAG